MIEKTKRINASLGTFSWKKLQKRGEGSNFWSSAALWFVSLTPKEKAIYQKSMILLGFSMITCHKIRLFCRSGPIMRLCA